MGLNLKILTSILLKYDNKYIEDLKKVKKVNFDCGCAYDIEDIKYEEWSRIDKFSLDDCIFVANELEYKTVSEELINFWKKDVKIWNEENIEKLISYNKFSDLEERNGELLKKLLLINKEKKDNFEIILEWKEIIQFYIKFQNFEKARKNFLEMIEASDFSLIFKLSLHGHRLLNELLFDCLKIIKESKKDDVKVKKEIEKLWNWAEKYLKLKLSLKGFVSLSLRKQIMETAEIMGEEGIRNKFI